MALRVILACIAHIPNVFIQFILINPCAEQINKAAPPFTAYTICSAVVIVLVLRLPAVAAVPKPMQSIHNPIYIIATSQTTYPPYPSFSSAAVAFANAIASVLSLSQLLLLAEAAVTTTSAME